MNLERILPPFYSAIKVKKMEADASGMDNFYHYCDEDISAYLLARKSMVDNGIISPEGINTFFNELYVFD